MTRRTKSEYVFFGNGIGYDGPNPWRGTYGVTVEADKITYRPNKKATALIVLRDDEGNTISGTPEDVRKLGQLLLQMTEPKAAQSALAQQAKGEGEGGGADG